MDLIYTNAKREDIGVLDAYELDMAFGADENDFELILDEKSQLLEFNSLVYAEGTEYGGIIDSVKISSAGGAATYGGRTWHGVLNSKVIEPDPGQDHLIVSGDANTILTAMISRLGLSELFTAKGSDSGISIPKYQFYRYCKGYDGLKAMVEKHGGKLMFSVETRKVVLSAVEAADYTDLPEDNDTATLQVEQCKNKVNHLVCLGTGELADREVIHLYADQNGNISGSQYYTGLNEIAEVYENTASDDLEYDGSNRLKELRDVDIAEVSLPESESRNYDIGDIVGASELKTTVSVSGKVSKKIVKIQNGAIRVEYTVGG